MRAGWRRYPHQGMEGEGLERRDAAPCGETAGEGGVGSCGGAPGRCRGGLGRSGQPRPAALRRGTLLPPCGCDRPCTRSGAHPRPARGGHLGTARPRSAPPASPPGGDPEPPPERTGAAFPPRILLPPAAEEGAAVGGKFSRGMKRRFRSHPEPAAPSLNVSKPPLRSRLGPLRGRRPLGVTRGWQPVQCHLPRLAPPPPFFLQSREAASGGDSCPRLPAAPYLTGTMGRGPDSCHFAKPPRKTSLPKQKHDAGRGGSQSPLRFPTQSV